MVIHSSGAKIGILLKTLHQKAKKRSSCPLKGQEDLEKPIYMKEREYQNV